jgi:hypothetical protein
MSNEKPESPPPARPEPPPDQPPPEPLIPKEPGRETGSADGPLQKIERFRKRES